MQSIERLLLENKVWATETKQRDPNYFKEMAQNQSPEFLWIGCSDSRVSAVTIMNLRPGEIFVQRNIANQIIATDFNCLSVIQYAVQVLKVRDVIVCGHYNCGGVKAAMSPQDPELLLANKWLMHIKDLYKLHREEIDALPTRKEQLERLVELNVIHQVYNLSHLSIVQDAWEKDRSPTIHGWVYSISDGILQPLITLPPGSDIDVIFKQKRVRKMPVPVG